MSFIPNILKNKVNRLIVTFVAILFVIASLAGIISHSVLANNNSKNTTVAEASTSGKDCTVSLPRAELKRESDNRTITAMTTVATPSYIILVNISTNQVFKINSNKLDFQHKNWRWPFDGCAVYKAYFDSTKILAGTYRADFYNVNNQKLGDTLNTTLGANSAYSNSAPAISHFYQPQAKYYHKATPVYSNYSSSSSAQNLYLNVQSYSDVVVLGYYSNYDDITLVNTPGVDTKSLQDFSNLLAQRYPSGYSNCNDNDWRVGSCSYMEYLRNSNIIYPNDDGYWTLSHQNLYNCISSMENSSD